MKPNWEYGKSPDPSNWHEAVEILKQQQSKKNDLLDRLTRIEQSLKKQQKKQSYGS